MVEQNKHQTWGDNVGAAYREQLRLAKESDAVPFGEERLTNKESRARFDGMSPPERERLIAEKGEKAVIDMLRGG